MSPGTGKAIMNRMLHAFVFCPVLLASNLFADGQRTLIFSDDFSRNESQEEREEVGNGWGTNSKSRAAGNKQVDLRNGAMHIHCHEVADHAVSVTHPAEFQDGSIELRFMLEGDKDSLGLDLADQQLKTVHAGHLFIVRIGTKQVEIIDHKSGGMNMELYEAKKAKHLTAEQTKMLAGKTKRFPHMLETGSWHGLKIDMVGDTVTVYIDGKEIGAFSSAGFAHPTKRMLRLSVPKNAVVDDLMVYSMDG
jgi:hypothetical protein